MDLFANTFARLFAHVDNYCERTDPSLWSEPLNALTNLAFLIAGIALWRQARSTGSRGEMQTAVRAEVRALALLIVCVGLCSGLFHVFGTVWGMWLDVGSIALFILAFLHRYLRRIVAWPAWACWLGVLAFIAADRAIAALGNLGLNGSEGYLLPGAILCLFALGARRQARAAVPWLSAATLLFALSLTLRTLDMALCAAWPTGIPIGTHFAWHLLNALVLYCSVRGLAAGAART
ncbi:MAG: hypothetical protein JWL63_2229 [Rhodocyclales bacterium]|nr:hypothetical protein [Rhodocyclales bacterium]